MVEAIAGRRDGYAEAPLHDADVAGSASGQVRRVRLGVLPSWHKGTIDAETAFILASYAAEAVAKTFVPP